MNELEFQEEWLSAYLDDELTDEQRQVVEQRLAIDPAAQATLEDLQRVRSMITKLPSWSGPDLKFAIPTGTPGSFDEEDDATDDELGDEIENDSDELDDFEEVPRVVSGADEPRVGFRERSSGDISSRSWRSMIAWGAMAATVLLVAGLGSIYHWQPTRPEVAYAPSVEAMAAKSAPSSAVLERATDNADGLVENRPFENTESQGRGLSPAGTGAVGDASVFGAPVAGGDQSGTMQAASDPASLAKVSELPEAPPRSDLADAKAKSQVDPTASSPVPAPPGNHSGAAYGGVSGIGGTLSDTDLAMRNLPADAPAAELPPPAPMRSSAIETADTMNTANAVMGKKAEVQNRLPEAGFFYARSQSWSDDETLSRLPPAPQQNRADQLAFGNSAYQRAPEQNFSDVANESVLMAAIKPEVANSPESFQQIVTSNRLIEVDQRSVLNQFALTDVAPMANTSNDNLPNNNSVVDNSVPNSNLPNNSLSNNSPATGRLEAPQNSALTNQTLNALGLNRFSNQRYQMAAPNQPQGNSFVLFVTREEANQILSQLREKGQVTSQIWTVDKQAGMQLSAGNQSYNANTMQSQNAANQRAVNEPSNQTYQKAEPSINDKVILLLNGPPN